MNKLKTTARRFQTLVPGIRLAIIALALAGSGDASRAGAAPPPQAASQPAREFLFGADFDPQAPDAIKALFYESGMNCVRMTGGGYAWSAGMHKKLADEFEARGLKVYMQLGSHYPSGDYLSLTDAYMVDQDGKQGVPDRKVWAVTYSGQAWPQYSYSSLPFRGKLEKDFANYVGQFKSNHNIAGVILHNEAGFFWLSDRVFDYNPANIADFRKWLQTEHGGIAALNARWGTSYASFSDAVPPGKPPVKEVAAWMDWRRFQVREIAGFMEWESGFFKTLRPDIPRATNLDGPLNNWYGYRCANMEAYSAAMDRVGIDIYPSPYTRRGFVPYSVDMAEGVAQGRPVNVLECDVFGPKLWKQFSETERAGLLRSELWTMIGHGVDGILLWGFNRSDDFSLTDGAFNERLLAVRDLASQCRMIGIGDFHRTPSRVAICVDPDSYLHESAVETKPLSLTSSLDREYQGFHAALRDAGIQADVLFLSQLRAGLAKQYGAIVLPAAMMMDDGLAALLTDYVREGGTLIASSPFSRMDRWGKSLPEVPGFGLSKLFGITAAGGEPAQNGSITTPQGTMDVANREVGLNVDGARVTGTFADGTPAVTMNRFGRGRAIFIAGRAGQPYLSYSEPGSLPLVLAEVLRQSSILPGIGVQADGRLDASVITGSRGSKLVVFSVLGSEGKLPAAINSAQVTCPCDGPQAYRAGFAFPATAEENGIVRSGPVPIGLIPAQDGKAVAFTLPEIVSSLPVLLARDAGPLLAVEAPQAIAGGEGAVTVTCYNPSAAAVRGELRLLASASIQPIAGTPVGIAPYGSVKAIVKFKTGAPAPRVPLTVTLTRAAQAGQVTSVPVDVAVQ